MLWFLTLSFVISMFSSPAYAGFEKGSLTWLDRWGGAPPFSEQEQAYQKHLRSARKGGKLSLAVSDPIEIIWPGHFQRSIEKNVMPFFKGYVYETLMAPDPVRSTRLIRAGLAKSVEADPEHKTYLIHLREDARFSDGVPVNADDIIRAYSFHREEIAGMGQRFYYDGLWGKPDLEAVSPSVVRLGFPQIAPEHQREALYEFLTDIPIVKKNTANSPDVKVPYEYIGSGPYGVLEADRDRCRLRRRADYSNSQNDLFNFDEILMTVYRDRVVQREALKRGDISLYEERDVQGERELDPFAATNNYEKHDLPLPPDQIEMNVLFLNMDHEHIRDSRFRKALMLAMDWDAAKDLLFAGKLSRVAAPGALSPFSPQGLPSPEVLSLLGAEPGLEEARTTPYENLGYLDVAKLSLNRDRLRAAMNLFKGAGYVIDPETKRLTKDGKAVQLSILQYVQDPYRGLLLMFKGNLQRVGIEVDLRNPQDITTYIAEVSSQRHDMVRHRIEIPHAFDFLDADVISQRLRSNFAKPDMNNFSNLRSKAMDAAIDILHAQEPDSPLYKNAVDAILRILSNKMPFIMLGERTTKTVYADAKICLPPAANALLGELISVAYYCRH